MTNNTAYVLIILACSSLGLSSLIAGVMFVITSILPLLLN